MYCAVFWLGRVGGNEEKGQIIARIRENTYASTLCASTAIVIRFTLLAFFLRMHGIAASSVKMAKYVEIILSIANKNKN